MIFGYKIDESISLKILEQREAPLLFKLVDSNREYLSEFLPFVEYTTTVEDSKSLYVRRYNNLVMAMAFTVGFGSMENLSASLDCIIWT